MYKYQIPIPVGIYKITNTVNGKSYIGQSVDVFKRLRDHKRKLEKHARSENRELKREWKIYGKENFSFEILELCNVVGKTKVEVYYWLKQNEVFYIKKYGSDTYGYNSKKYVAPDWEVWAKRTVI